MCAMHQPSFLADIFDQVQCAVCLEIFNEPHSLQCRHTFCKKCLENLAKDGLITCPTCRKETPLDSIVSDFQANAIVEVYQKQAEATKTKLPKPDTKCEFCEFRWMQFFCRSCHRALCDACLACHCKLTRCEPEQAENVKNDFQDFVEELQVEQKKLEEEINNVHIRSKNTMEENSQIAEKCIQQIKEDQEKTFQLLSKWYEKQTGDVRATEARSNSIVEKMQEELLVGAEKNKEEINRIIENGSAAKEVQGDLKRKLKEEIAWLQNAHFTAAKCNFSNNPELLKTICASKVLTLRESTIVLKNQEGPVWKESTSNTKVPPKPASPPENLFQKFKTNGLQMSFLKNFNEPFVHFQVVGKEIWVLYKNRVDVIEASVSYSYSQQRIIKTVTNDKLANAQDMYIHPSGAIFIADANSGLLLSTLDSLKFICLTTEKFVALIPSETGAVWAVEHRTEQHKHGYNINTSIVHKCIFHDDWHIDDNKIILKDCCVRKGAVSGTKLFFNQGNRILEVDTITQARVQHGTGQTSQKALGELSQYFKVISDVASGLLLILDKGLLRLQIFDPNTSCWYPVNCIDAQGNLSRPSSPTHAVVHKNAVYIAFCSETSDGWQCRLYKCLSAR